jgi:hypothetical protein
VSIVIDGLDECSERERGRVLRELSCLCDTATEAVVKVAITSGVYADIATYLSHALRVHVDASINSEDIMSFVSERVDLLSSQTHLQWVRSTGFLQEAKSILHSEANGVFVVYLSSPHTSHSNCNLRFLWAKLQLDAIDALRWEPAVRQQLKELPSGLAKTYDKLKKKIRNLDGISRTLSEEAFTWTFHSQRPLSPEELRHALMIGNKRNVFEGCHFTLRDILDVCQNLLVHDEVLNLVNPLHSSVQTYWKTDYEDTSGIHAAIAESCLRYEIQLHRAVFGANEKF